ncbi:MAG: NAD regulator [Alphaproteobacteria bacterium]|nr:NAD regulator [Alphaproteobacteria bacterium]MDE2161990.1 NAD regulator [Alphaproteobacteria bacterium]MDE2265436.1 NAD regulator [Alphaproteobacteria bacterium]MDE2500204.1 NAD regulator [Alphaproteobacteria bacterium]
MSPAEQHAVAIGLSAAIVSVTEEQPSVLVVRHPEDGSDALPFGPFNPLQHRTLESGLRKWVGEQTYLDLGYAEQLYTFGDRGRHEMKSGEGPRVVSVGYLALTRQGGALNAPDTLWRDWYRYFPWEDWRGEKPAVIADAIVPALKLFVKAAPDGPTAELRRDRMRLCFGLDGLTWDEEKVLERYELLYEAGVVLESARDGRANAKATLPLGTGMLFDHRRILATAIARLRGKMKYRPVVFELMPPAFTLLELQRTVEAISGIRLHKQNFRRLVEGQGLVEGTGKMSALSRGRPAELFRFRREVLRERPSPGVRLGARRPG